MYYITNDAWQTDKKQGKEVICLAVLDNWKDLPWSKKVRIAMIAKGLSVSDLAERTCRSRPYVSAIINGRVFAAPVNKMISDILDIEYEEVQR